MADIKRNVDLTTLNTFGVSARAETFTEITQIEDFDTPEISSLLTHGETLILGGGSNVLLVDDIPAVTRVHLKGIEIIEQNRDTANVRVAAGEVWHEFVLWSLRQGLSGIENLSLIPGTVGAAPIQNIGAYGVEVKDCIVWVEAWHRVSKKHIRVEASECDFGYRSSIFKKELLNKVCITDVIFRLNKKPKLSLNYGAIRDTLTQKGITSPTPTNVSEAVCAIRRSKLPDPAELGNAGSFFKNPVISQHQLTDLKAIHPSIPSYSLGGNLYKIPAAWLIEQCGWKGKRVDNVGSHHKQPLVLVHYGSGAGRDILQLSKQIQSDVQSTFGIIIEREVQVRP